jgi:putative transposase
MIDVLFRYRDQGRYALHAFVVMSDHLHVVITPSMDQSIERCVQCMKGGYSRLCQSKSSIWQRGFHEHRLRDSEDYTRHIGYIEQNPIKRGLRDHKYIHTMCEEKLDGTPEHLRG